MFDSKQSSRVRFDTSIAGTATAFKQNDTVTMLGEWQASSEAQVFLYSSCEY